MGKRALLYLLLSFSFLVGGIHFLFGQPFMGGGAFEFKPVECVTDKQSNAIRQELVQTVKDLTLKNLIPSIQIQSQVKFNWPVRLSADSRDPSMYGISNYVDQNLAYPNQLKDYNCGTRTYDQSSGYNHRGIDIYSWPFSQLRQQQGMVIVVAAAPGVVIQKSDGNPDNSCSFCSSACNWNAVYVRHSDGSVAWYGHLKSGSLTSKAVGQSIADGEYIGVMGSSGNSTGPHLHFEVWTNSNYTQLVDPFAGPCNDLNGTTSWWNTQREYRRPTVNKIMTGSAPPVFPACPQIETTNEKNVFAFGDPLCVTNFFQDQLQGQQYKMELILPNGTVWNTWNGTSPNTYGSSWWYWNPWYLPNVAGYWKYRLTYTPTGQEVSHTFYHGNNPPVYTIKPGNWNDPSIWSGGAVPASNADLFVCYPVTLSSNQTINSLVVNEDGRVMVADGFKLTVQDITMQKGNERGFVE